MDKLLLKAQTNNFLKIFEMAVSGHTIIQKIANFLYGVVILVLAGSAYSSICYPPNYIPKVTDNWKNLNIYDIVTVNGTQSCPFGYEEVNFPYVWPGSYSGCYCAYNGRIYEDSCTGNQQSQGCVEVPETSSFEMRVWRGSILCVWRGGTSVFWASNPDSCDSKYNEKGERVDFVKCGNGDYSICAEKTLGCPVNKVKLQNAQEPGPNDFGYQVYFGEEMVLYYDKSPDSNDLPIVDLAISQEGICFQEYNEEPKDLYYPLLKEKPNKCEYEDSRYTQLDSLPQEKFFNENNQQDVVNTLPQLNSTSYNYIFSYRRSILWKEPCKGGYFSMENLDGNEDALERSENIQIALLVADCILAFYLMILDPIMYTCFYRKSEVDINEYDQPLFSMGVVERFLKIASLPVLIAACVITTKYNIWYYNLENRYCSDPLTNASFEFVNYVLNDTYAYNWSNFAVTLSLLFLDIVLSTMLFISKTRENFG